MSTMNWRSLDRNKPYFLVFEFIVILLAGSVTTCIIQPLWYNYLPMVHTLLEMVCILIAFSTFVVAWNNYEYYLNGSRIIGFGFLMVAVFDIFHSFFFQTTLFNYLYSREMAAKFWILGRLCEAFVLIAVTLRVSKKPRNKFKSLFGTISVLTSICSLVFFFPYKLRLWTENGMTPLKIILEFLVILILITAFIPLTRKKNYDLVNYRYLFIAIFLSITAEINFTFYKDNLVSFFPALGHILRAIYYAYLFKGVFKRVAAYPYKKMEDALNLSENLFKIAFDNAAIGMALVSREGKWIKVNNSLCDILGYERVELMNTTYQELIHNNDTVKYTETINYLASSASRPVVYEKLLTCRNGDVIWVLINKSLIKDNDNAPLFLVVQIENITDRKKAHELEKHAIQNELLVKEAKELEQLRTEFFANLSHEFRTPLNVILGAIQLIELNIKNSALSGANKIQVNLRTMKQNCLRLLRLISNLIDITKIDAGFFHLNLENHNIVNVVEEIALSVAEYMKNKGITLIFDTDIEEKVIACDPDKIERIILNILSNSIKFTDKGGVINVDIHDNGDFVEIVVKDTGTGIPEDKVGIIFERFRQADKSTTRNREGSGIGLSLVKSLVEMHNGTVSLYSKYGEGCTITVKLPAAVLNQDKRAAFKTNSLRSDHIERINVEFSDIYFPDM